MSGPPRAIMEKTEVRPTERQRGSGLCRLTRVPGDLMDAKVREPLC